MLRLSATVRPLSKREVELLVELQELWALEQAGGAAGRSPHAGMLARPDVFVTRTMEPVTPGDVGDASNEVRKEGKGSADGDASDIRNTWVSRFRSAVAAALAGEQYVPPSAAADLELTAVRADEVALVLPALPVVERDDDFAVLEAGPGARFLWLEEDGGFALLGREVFIADWSEERWELTGRLYLQRVAWSGSDAAGLPEDGYYMQSMSFCVCICDPCCAISFPGCNDNDPCTYDVCDWGNCSYPPINCDDGDPCTTDSCGPGGCVHLPMNCNDGDPCTSDGCDEGSCYHIPYDCDDGRLCTTDTCMDGTCFHTPIDCNDGDPCTYDTCMDGACFNTPMNCNTGNPCRTGTCIGGTCHFTDMDCGDGDPCTSDSCEGGACVHDVDPCCVDPCSCDPCCNSSGQRGEEGECCDDEDCDDGDFCNGVETCFEGHCIDGEPCPPGLCIEDEERCLGCLTSDQCDDGVFCNGPETCQEPEFVCVAGVNPCPLWQTCDEASRSCIGCDNGIVCDDGLWCNGEETCNQVTGKCMPGTPRCAGMVCDEANDQCVECLDDSQCLDDVYCNGVEFCFAGVCIEGTPPCPSDRCIEELEGCVQCTKQEHCDDGLWCNGQERCLETYSCQAGTYPCSGPCDESADKCLCEDDGDCDEYTFCEGLEVCNMDGHCERLPPPSCDDEDPCTADCCPVNACLHGPKAMPCSVSVEVPEYVCPGSATPVTLTITNTGECERTYKINMMYTPTPPMGVSFNPYYGSESIAAGDTCKWSTTMYVSPTAVGGAIATLAFVTQTQANPCDESTFKVCTSHQTISVIRPDVRIVGMNPLHKLMPGGLIGDNNDDDNNNGVPDRAEAGPVQGEDDLLELALSVGGPTSGLDGAFTLNVAQATQEVRLFAGPDRSGPIALPYVRGPDDLPAPVYLEGNSRSVAPRDVALQFRYTPEDGSWFCEDILSMTVVDARIEAACGPEPLPVNPPIIAQMDMFLSSGEFFGESNRFQITTLVPMLDLSTFPFVWTFTSNDGQSDGDITVEPEADLRAARVRFLPLVPLRERAGKVAATVSYPGQAPHTLAQCETLVKNLIPDPFADPDEVRKTKVRVHLCFDGAGGSTIRTPAEVRQLISEVTLLLSQCGVVVQLYDIIWTEVLPSQLEVDSTDLYALPVLLLRDHDWAAIDLYFIPAIDFDPLQGCGGTCGITFTPAMSGMSYEGGIVIADSCCEAGGGNWTPRAMAHEIVHYLMDNGNPEDDHTGPDCNLMTNFNSDQKRFLEAEQCLEIREDWGVD